MSLTSTIRKMAQAGFTVRAVGEQLMVANGNKLNEAQRIWIQQHKTELLAYLAVQDDPHLQVLMQQFDAEIMALHPLAELPE